MSEDQTPESQDDTISNTNPGDNSDSDTPSDTVSGQNQDESTATEPSSTDTQSQDDAISNTNPVDNSDSNIPSDTVNDQDQDIESLSTDTGATQEGEDNSISNIAVSDTQSADPDQTPADQLTMDLIEPQFLVADASLLSEETIATTADQDNVGFLNEGESGKGASVADVIAIGTTIAKIMADSAPDYTMKSNPVAVLPRDVDPVSLTGVAADPRELKLTVRYRNYASMLLCNLPIVVQWRYGGRNKGVGRYISNASIFLDSGTDVGIFYKVDIDASMTDPWYAGGPSAPVAVIDINVKIKVSDKITPVGFYIVLMGSIRGDGAGSIHVRP